jgi:acyl-CoA synthetase (AMP-forming)/AMP-acid ligase II
MTHSAATSTGQAATASWDKRIAVEEIGGVPFRMYTDRPKRISRLFKFADCWGSRPYVIQSDRVVTFEGLRKDSAAKALQLTRGGVGYGDRVLVLGWNSVDWVLNVWACIRLGAVPVLGNTWWSAGEVEDALILLRPTLVLADPAAATKIPGSWARGAWEVEAASEDFSPLVDGWDEGVSGNENDPAAIIFTSGTAGRAKAVVLAHRSLLAQLLMLMHVTRRLPYVPDQAAGEVALHTGPLFHIGGIQALLRGVTMGNTLVLLSGRFDPAEALALIEQHKISRWNAVPTMATRLLEHPDIRTRDLRSLRTVTLGGSAVHPELMDKIRSGFPGADSRVATGYGLSENAGQATAAGGADTVGKPGSCGRPLPCVELELFQHPGLPDGEVLVRSPTQMLGYFGETESPIDAEGWLHTGDLGRIDEDGHLWITGRCKDIIIRGGENISPAAVEGALGAVPGVVEAAVFGLPHPELGEEVMAVVVVDGDQTADQLRDEMRGRVASFSIPTKWRVQKEPLPVNQTGKVDKRALAADAIADAEKLSA